MATDNKVKQEKISILPIERVVSLIVVIRGEKVILDDDLAALYGVETRRLNEQVRRNKDRFPEDFLFQLTKEEFENLKSQNATSSSEWGGRRKLPNAFTEHGALMAASVLNTQQAVEMSVFVIRAFVRLRNILNTQKALADKVQELEQRLTTHDTHIARIIEAIKQLTASPQRGSTRQIGFLPKQKGEE